MSDYPEIRKHGCLFDPRGGSGAGWLPNFGGLVLGCMDSYDSDQRLILQGFLRSTRLAFLCTAPISNLQSFAPLIFAIFFRKIAKHFDEVLLNFCD